MADVTKMIEPRSDQINYEDLLSGPVTSKINSVDVKQSKEQPISVHLEEWSRPWKPCKSMARVMASVWGKDSASWVGQSVTLFGDPSVRWAGAEVGGIRIQAMTGIEKPLTINLTVTRGKRKPFTVQPLQAQASTQQAPQHPGVQPQQQAPQQPTEEETTHFATAIGLAADMQQLAAAWGRIPPHVKASLSSYKDARKLEIEAMQLAPQQEQKPQDISNF